MSNRKLVGKSLTSFVLMTLGFLNSIIFANTFSPQELGTLQLLITIASFLSVIITFGAGTVILKNPGAGRDISGLYLYLLIRSLKIFTVLIFFLFILVFIGIVEYEKLYTLVIILIYSLIQSIYSIEESNYLIQEKLSVSELIKSSPKRLVPLLVLCVMIITSSDEITLYLEYLVSILFLLWVTLIRKNINLRIEISKSTRREIYLLSRSLIFVSMFSMLFMWGDTFIISTFLPMSDLAYYNMAYTIGSVVKIVSVIAFSGVAISRVSQSNDINKYKDVACLSSRISMSISIIILVLGALVYNVVLPIEYMPTIGVMYIITLGMALSSLLGPVYAIVVHTNKIKKYNKIIFSMVVFNMIFNYILVNKFGIFGVALITSVGEFLLTMSVLLLCRDSFDVLFYSVKKNALQIVLFLMASFSIIFFRIGESLSFYIKGTFL